ncbi:hematopoietic prostaglandin D synthase-like isoform X1 [Glandiceps talaboti]
MPQYRLTYYNCRSIAETARLIFAVAGVDYEDVRFEIRGEQWAKEKKTDKYPFRQIPILEFDGVVLAQSKAISRYLAMEHGLAGKDNLENARIDMITGAIEDLVKGMLQFHYYEKDEDKKKVLESEYKANKEPVILKGLEKLLKDNNGGDGYFVGDDLTWADLDFLAGIEDNISRDTMVLDNYPKLRALRERVMALPKIAAWLEKRPQTYV